MKRVSRWLRAALPLALAIAGTPRIARADEHAPHAAPAEQQGLTRTEPEAEARSPADLNLDARLGLAGTYRALGNVPIFAGGLSLSISGNKPVSPGFLVRGLYGRTDAGLTTFDLDASFSVEVKTTDHLHFHAGGGVGVFGVRRATTGEVVIAYGPSAMVGIGYDPGGSLFVMLDVDSMLYPRGIVVGPTFTFGVRF